MTLSYDKLGVIFIVIDYYFIPFPKHKVIIFVGSRILTPIYEL